MADRFVFVHVPKTGGTYCRKVIEQCHPGAIETGLFAVEDHYGVEECIVAHPELQEKRFLGFIRHPVTWYKSRWAWGIKSDFGEKIRNKEPGACAHWMADIWSDDFSDFIDGVIDQFQPRALATFHSKLTVAGQWIRPIGKYEDLVADLYALTGCKSKKIKPQRVGAKELEPVYTQSQLNLIVKLEKEIIQEFYYDYNVHR